MFEKLLQTQVKLGDDGEAAPSIASMENLHGAIPDPCCIERWLQRRKHGEEEGKLARDCAKW